MSSDVPCEKNAGDPYSSEEADSLTSAEPLRALAFVALALNISRYGHRMHVRRN